MKLGEMLGAYMRVEKLTTRQMGKRLGLDHTAVHRFIHGEKGLSDRNLAKLIIWMFSNGDQRHGPNGD